MNDTSKIILSAVGGAVAGAVTALLLAPSSGEETRRKLANNASRMGSNIGDRVRTGWDKVARRSQEVPGGRMATGYGGNMGMHAGNAPQEGGMGTL